MKYLTVAIASLFLLSACDTNKTANTQMGIAATAIMVGTFFAAQ